MQQANFKDNSVWPANNVLQPKGCGQRKKNVLYSPHNFPLSCIVTNENLL